MSYKLGFRSLLFLGVLMCASISITPTFGNNPPKPFWNWNDRISRKLPLGRTAQSAHMNNKNVKTHSKAAKNQFHYDSTKNEPPLFWSYYKNAARTVNKVSTEQGSYTRDSPKSWTGNPTHTAQNTAEKDSILLLGVRSKMSHGPRRRFKRALKKQQSSNATKSELTKIHYVYALPLRNDPNETNISDITVSKTNPEQQHGILYRSDDDLKAGVTAVVRGTQHIWKPYSASYIGRIDNPGVPTSQRRYDDEICNNMPSSYCKYYTKPHPCCTRRFLHVEPFVQPTLLENWMSAIFEFGGRNPAAYDVVKQVMTLGTVIVMALLWYRLGVSFGVINSNSKTIVNPNNQKGNTEEGKAFDNWIDVDLFTGEEDPIENSKLVEQLENSIKLKTSSFKGTNNFLCCLVGKNLLGKKYSTLSSKDGDFSQDKKFRCHAISKMMLNRSETYGELYTRKIARLNSATDAMDCENGNLAYQFTIAN